MLSELSYSLQRALNMIETDHLLLTAAIATGLCISIFFLTRMGVEFFRFWGSHRYPLGCWLPNCCSLISPRE
jgi:hypothetical protein